MLVNFEMTQEQAEFLSEILHDHWDCGPYDEGWASDELMDLCNFVDKAIDKTEVKGEK